MYQVKFRGTSEGEDRYCPLMGNIYFSEEEEGKAMVAAQVVVKNGACDCAQVFHDGEFVKIFTERKC